MFLNAEPQNNQEVQCITFLKCRKPLSPAWHAYFKTDKRIISTKQTIRQLTVLRELKQLVPFKHRNVSCRLWCAEHSSLRGTSAAYFGLLFFPAFMLWWGGGVLLPKTVTSNTGFCEHSPSVSVSEPNQSAALVLLLILRAIKKIFLHFLKQKSNYSVFNSCLGELCLR